MVDWSQYQRDIFDFDKSHCFGFVDAKAGSGKSTVIEQCARERTDNHIVVAFNSHIADAMSARLPGSRCQTLHSFAWAQYRKQHRCKLAKWKTMDIYQDLVTSKVYEKTKWNMKRCISIMKSMMLTAIHPADLEQLMLDFDCEGLECDHVNDVMQRSIDDMRNTDFDDMLFMTLIHQCPIEEFDHVYVDEVQDLSLGQIMIVSRMKPKSGLFVGDPFQSIYQFRGADEHALEKIKSTFDCHRLPLSVSYRCSKAVIREAQKIVPEIEAWENSPEGSFNVTQKLSPVSGDFVLCRTTAPLVIECLKFVKNGGQGYIRGKDVGSDILKFVAEAKDDIVGYFDRKIANTRRLQTKIMYQDYFDIVRQIPRHDLDSTIKKLFKDDGEGVMFSTGHRSKGLEANGIHVIRPDLLPHPKARDLQPEYNLEYIMQTRAKRDLTWVAGPDGEDDYSRWSDGAN